ncbi:hypothetical protein [Pseudomonas arsenicoxydans]|uniref:Uncharacterized protein n=1 Tax=Pseudomonas arsenicoxydans TaxID=702115 RepID=A0A4P6FZ15_9PSED|nr:hypothetical protein [Pseudomonas arsenicoxydans]QAY84169.1 hypothetical protein CUN61_09290 [Pseudomonas arsenicoxydans]
MADFLTSTWEFIAELPVGGWAVIGGLVTALIAALVSLLNTRRTLDVQRLTNARSASTFIADKRQKWIDDLRNDTSKYMSLSLETAEAWKQLYWKCGNEHDEHYHLSPQDVLKVCESLRIDFLIENAARDSEHHQIYMRIILRLNNNEDSHQKLMTDLLELRTHMRDLAMAALRGSYSNQELLDSIATTLSLAAEHTKIILKGEWQRLKREVADPERLIREILSTSKSKMVSEDTLLRKPAPRVAPSLSQEIPLPLKTQA